LFRNGRKAKQEAKKAKRKADRAAYGGSPFSLPSGFLQLRGFRTLSPPFPAIPSLHAADFIGPS